MKKLYIIIFGILVLFQNSCLFAQKEAWNWYFGLNAGITFSTAGKNPVFINDGQLSTWEGCSSISDSTGQLLFYTDGMSVWNKKHEIMPNGSGLPGDKSASQSALIVPKPGSNNIFYVFTVDREAHPEGLNYSVVDLYKQSGLGEVTEKNVLLHTPVSEKLCGTKHANNRDYWIVAHDFGTNQFLSYLITENGLNNNPLVSYAGAIQNGYGVNMAVGCIKISPDGRKLAQAVTYGDYFELFDFDNSTGIVSNTVTMKNFQKAYGVEFSPDCSKLYGSLSFGISGLVQFDLKAGSEKDIVNSAKVIDTSASPGKYTLQLGPDNKIYVALWNYNYLGVINNPDSSGSGCNYIQNAIPLTGNICLEGLPNLLNSYNKPFIDTNCRNHPFGYISFQNPNPLIFIGSANKNEDYIRLTGVARNSIGAVWFPYRLPVEPGFITTFDFRTSQGNNFDCPETSLPGGDGIAFVIQNSSNRTNGLSGGGIGYEGISNSIAVEFDTFSNDSLQLENYSDPNGNHAAILSMGNRQNTSKHNPESTLGMNKDIIQLRPDNTIYHVKIEYNINPGRFSVFLDTTLEFKNPILSLSNFDIAKMIDLRNGDAAFLGFTSSTGNATEIHDILNWNICLVSDNSIADVQNEEYIKSEIPDFEIYPNPANKYLKVYFENNLTNASFLVYNELGIKVIEKSIETNVNTEINISNLYTGVYYCIIKSGNLTRTKQIVIIH